MDDSPIVRYGSIDTSTTRKAIIVHHKQMNLPSYSLEPVNEMVHQNQESLIENSHEHQTEYGVERL